MPPPDDVYSRLDYRRLIAWPQRIEREWPFLRRVLEAAPSRRLLDLGCGTGEHVRFLASQGFDVVGIDRSESMLEKARETPTPPGARLIQGDIVDMDALVDGRFGGAICLGNTLPHIREIADLSRLARGLRRRLEPGAPFVLQILNYERIFETGVRHLPLNFRQEGDAEILFLRLMQPGPDGAVVFTPSTLRYRPGREPPLEVLTSRNVLLQGWRRGQLEGVLAEAAFQDRTAYGTVGAVAYARLESPDLVIVAR